MSNEVKKEIQKEVAKQVAAAATKKPRKSVTPPTESEYAFKEGDQVVLVNLKHPGEKKFRSHYEYVELGERYHKIRDVRNGTMHRVWLNKLMPVSKALALQKQVLKANAA